MARGGGGLGRADVGLAENRLAVKVALVHAVGIDQGDLPHARPDQILQHRRGQPPRTDHQQARSGQAVLSVRPKGGHGDLAGVAAHPQTLSQSRTRPSGSGFRVMSVTADTTSAPASNAPGARSTDMPPIAIRGVLPMRDFHVVSFSTPC